MLEIMNRYIHGYVFIPVLLACRNKKLFEYLLSNEKFTCSDLSQQLDANEGHLTIALNMLEALNWMKRPCDNTYQLNLDQDTLQFIYDIPNEILECYKLSVNTCLTKFRQRRILSKWLNFTINYVHANTRLVDFLKGTVIVPLILALKTACNKSHSFNSANTCQEQTALFLTLINQLPYKIKFAILNFLCKQDWLDQNGQYPSLTTKGLFMFERSFNMATSASYAPMLLNIAEVIFGTSQKIFKKNSEGNESHIDRTLNVLGSGFAHERYFKDMEHIISDIFNRLPLESQPKYIIDMGCGDGTLLKRTYEAIISKSLRGQEIEKFPLTMIGVDYNQKSLEATNLTLKNIPHFTLHGDVNDPNSLIEDLKSMDIIDPENSLHIRSFLDHDRTYCMPENKLRAESRSVSGYWGTYVDNTGKLIKLSYLIEDLINHFERWSAIINKHGLIVLDVHCLRPNLIEKFLDQNESFHFDALQAFSSQNLVEPELFILAAAEAGLLPNAKFSKRYPQIFPFSRITLHFFEKQNYILRQANLNDLPDLLKLEQQCWPLHLQLCEEQIKTRINLFREGQTVLSFSGEVKGVVYSQRINNTQDLQNINFSKLSELHCQTGSIMQLLSINIAKEVQSQGLGEKLLEFMLMRCLLNGGIKKIVGVTRCKNYNKNIHGSLQNYIVQHNHDPKGIDPILRFHTSHGAKIIGIIDNYREEDVDNNGCGVLIEYDIYEQDKNIKPLLEAVNHPEPISLQNFSVTEKVNTTIKNLMPIEYVATFDENKAMSELGLDSLALLELKMLLNQKFKINLNATFFFEYSTPKAIAEYMLKEASTEIYKCDDDENRKKSRKTIYAKPIIDSNITSEDSIAIIGMACKFPGGINNLDDFWQALITSKDIINKVPESRWTIQSSYAPATHYGGFIDDVDKFDAEFFNISPREAELMDPQQRILLEMVWHGLEYASIDAHQLRGSNTAVYIGAMNHDYEWLLNQRKVHHPSLVLNGLFGTGTSSALLAGRISYLFGFQGPAMTVNTACSSSLAAVHLACQSLRVKESDLAIAGGINLLLSPELSIVFNDANMLSPEGQCKTFDTAANGYVRSEGCGIVILKKLTQALRDNDRVLAIVRCTAMNQDGASNGLTAPNKMAQQALLKQALLTAQIRAEEINYVEAHGTGTVLGDPIEVNALTNIYAVGRTNKNPLIIGSVKSNIGHTEAAAGIAGLIKAVLCLQYQKIPAQKHFNQLNPHFDQVDKIKIPQTLINSEEFMRYAAISSFGFSGTNVHTIIEATAQNDSFDPDQLKSSWLITLSAKTTSALKQKVKELSCWLDLHSDMSLMNIAYTLNCGRVHFPERIAFVVKNLLEFKEVLRNYLDDQKSDFYFCSSVKDYSHDKPIFNKILKVTIEEIKNQVSNDREYHENLLVLANLYIKGYMPDWLIFFQKKLPQKINLPGYPFQKQCFWLPDSTQFSFINKKMIEFDLELSQSNHSIKSSRNQGAKEPVNASMSSLSLNGDEMLEFLNRYLQIAFAQETKLPVEKIDINTPLNDYGLNSLIIVELHRKLEKVLGEFSPSIFFKFNNLASLSHFFIANYESSIQSLANAHKLSASCIPLSSSNSSSNLSHLKDFKENIEAKKTIFNLNHSTTQDDIAIIGLSGQFPMASNIVKFWENLKQGRNCITEIPKERWDYQLYYDPEKGKPGKMYCKWGGFLEDYDKFDAAFFNISPSEAKWLDPQERLFLQCVHSCFESAGYTQSQIAQAIQSNGNFRIGVFAGVTFNNYQLVCADHLPQSKLESMINSQIFSIANRVSYFYNLNGPSLTIDTACSSSLYSLHLACQSINMGESTLAIAGGVNLTLHPSKYLMLCAKGFASSDGRCRSFAEGGDGYVPAEGVGAVLLKPFSLAIADNDQIYAIVKATAANHDGKTNGYAVPNPTAQTAVVNTALQKANIHPQTITYVEAHGTGTALGDPIEILALCSAFNSESAENQYCSIGSVKSNIGHLEAAAGIAQLIKVILQLKNKQLVPTLLHGEKLNPYINFSKSPFYVQQELQGWGSKKFLSDNDDDFINLPRRASISSFGAGGTNVCAIVEEYSAVKTSPEPIVLNQQFPVIIILSAMQESLLIEYASFLEKFLIHYHQQNPISGEEITLNDLAYTLQTGREAMPVRLAFVANSIQEVINKLNIFQLSRKQSNENDMQTGNLYFGDIKNIITPIATEVEFYENNTKLTRNQYENLAKQWVSGVSINWQTFYQNKKIKPIYVPTYAFAKDRHWISSSVSKKENILVKDEIQNLYLDRDINSRVLNTKNITLDYSPKIGNFLMDLADMPLTQQNEKIAEYCQKTISELLEYDFNQLTNHQQGFFEMGMESIQAMKLQKIFEEELNIHISDTALFDYPNIEKFSQYLLNLIPFNQILNSVQIAQFPQSTETNKSTILNNNKGQDSTANFAIEPTHSQLVTENESIAILGMSCRFPGGCDTPEKFWKLLKEGKEALSKIPTSRFNVDDYFQENYNSVGKMYVDSGNFLTEDIATFDPLFFNISPKEASELDPQQRILLELSWEAIERAGILAAQLKNSRTGVFIGLINSDYATLQQNPEAITPYTITGTLGNLASGRIAHFFGFQGPALTIDTACSSSLVGLHLACESLRRRECDLALAGGINIILSSSVFIMLCKMKALSRDGRCKVFDSSADGYGRGEGGGILVIKRLSDAIADKDPILAVIESSAINQDGPSSGLTVPNGLAQQALIRESLEKAHLDPQEINYIETHGTGTSLGDPIEVQALNQIFQNSTSKLDIPKKLYLGSVKANIGHLEAASGIASVIKSVLCLQNQSLPPQLHIRNLNPKINLQNTSFIIPNALLKFSHKENRECLNRIGISSFGFSGTNSHLIVKRYHLDTQSIDNSSHSIHPPDFLVLSAKDSLALRHLANNYLEFLEKNQDQVFRTNLCFTTNLSRDKFSYRLALMATPEQKLENQLRNYLDDVFNPLLIHNEDLFLSSSLPLYPCKKLVFSFTGHNSINLEDSLWLYQSFPTFKAILEHCNQIIESLVGVVNQSEKETNEYESRYSLVRSFSIQYALADFLIQLGIYPQAVCGDGLGILIAACVAEIISLEEVIKCLIAINVNVTKNIYQEIKNYISNWVSSNFATAKINYICNVSGKLSRKSQIIDKEFWLSQFSEQASFEKYLQVLHDEQFNVVLNIGSNINECQFESQLSERSIKFLSFNNEKEFDIGLIRVIGQFFCLGHDIKWDIFYEKGVYQKIVLPTYPFQRKHFWIDKIKQEPFNKGVRKDLSGRIIDSPLTHKMYEVELDLLQYPDLNDTHCVVHVGYFHEMLTQAVREIYCDKNYQIISLKFLSALILSKENQKVQIIFDRDNNTFVNLEIYAESNHGSPWKLLIQGRLQLDEKQGTSSSFDEKWQLSHKVDLESIKNKCNRKILGKIFYNSLNDRQLYLGDSVQIIEEIWVGDYEALAKFSRKNNLIDEERVSSFPLGVLDACAQLFNTQIGDNTPPKSVFMLTEWHHLMIDPQRCEDELYCWIKLNKDDFKDNKIVGSFILFDSNGYKKASCESCQLTLANLGRLQDSRERQQNVSSQHNPDKKNYLKSLTAHKLKVDYLAKYLSEILEETLGVKIIESVYLESINHFGMDSLSGSDLQNCIERDFNVKIAIEEIIIGPNILQLAEKIIFLTSNNELDKTGKIIQNVTPYYSLDPVDWLQPTIITQETQIKLFCLPYGGAGSSIYNNWIKKLSPFVSVIPIQLPGRENRINEQAIRNIDVIISILYDIITSHNPPLPYALYGHSMGALVAYCLAKRLNENNNTKKHVKHLFVGAFSAPQIYPNPFLSSLQTKLLRHYSKKLHEIDLIDYEDDQLKLLFEILKIAKDQYPLDLLKTYVPTLIADLAVVASYQHHDQTSLSIPVTVFHGLKDDRVSSKDMLAWNDLTTNQFSSYEFPGDHFFLHEDQAQDQLIEKIKAELSIYNLIGIN